MNEEVEEDPRALEPGICRVTTIGGTGIEWICIKPVHGSAYIRKSGDRTHRRGEVIFVDTRTSEAHYFVRRYPNRGNDG